MKRWIPWTVTAVVVVLLGAGVWRAMAARQVQQKALAEATAQRAQAPLQLAADEMLAVRRQTALDFHACMPAVPAATFERFIHLALPLIIGLWPLSHPAELAAEVVTRGDLVVLRYDLQGELHDGLLMMLRGLLSQLLTKR